MIKHLLIGAILLTGCYTGSGANMPAPTEYGHLSIPQLTTLAEKGDVTAQLTVADAYYFGQGVAKNFTEAAKWYHRAAEQNHAVAQFNLGCCYSNGDGVTRNESEAAKWLRKAAENNFVAAQFQIGCCYSAGSGVPRDLTEAVKWWLKAAEQNNLEAQFKLFSCYNQGLGVRQNTAEAIKWCRIAAEQNYVPAQFMLGSFYRVGLGVPKSAAEGYKWLNIAAGNGDKNAAVIRDSDERWMSPEQVAEGQRLSREFKPKQWQPSANEVATPKPQQQAPSKNDASVARHGPTAMNVVGMPQGAYSRKMFAEIGQRWTKLLEQHYANGQPGCVKLSFTLYPTGRVEHLKVVENTASPVLGNYCQKALTDCAPFDLWPQELKLLGGDHLDITISFSVYQYER